MRVADWSCVAPAGLSRAARWQENSLSRLPIGHLTETISGPASADRPELAQLPSAPRPRADVPFRSHSNPELRSMRSLVFSALAAVAVMVPATEADAQWATIKGQVVFPADKKLP